ncbi:MAG: hypothetical protein ACT4OI_02770 [Methanobacteriota archaeon]
MTYLTSLGAKVEDAAVAGGRFADALVRATGYLISGVFAFADKEMEYAARAIKERQERDRARRAGGKRPPRDKPT